MKRSTRLAGHGLPHEGRVWDGLTRQFGNYAGETHCSCGLVSPFLPTTAARKRWHGEHKDAIRATTAAGGAEGDQKGSSGERAS